MRRQRGQVGPAMLIDAPRAKHTHRMYRCDVIQVFVQRCRSCSRPIVHVFDFCACVSAHATRMAMATGPAVASQANCVGEVVGIGAGHLVGAGDKAGAIDAVSNRAVARDRVVVSGHLVGAASGSYWSEHATWPAQAMAAIPPHGPLCLRKAVSSAQAGGPAWHPVGHGLATRQQCGRRRAWGRRRPQGR